MKKFLNSHLLWQIVSGINFLGSIALLLPFMSLALTHQDNWFISFTTNSELTYLYNGLFVTYNPDTLFKFSGIWFSLSTIATILMLILPSYLSKPKFIELTNGADKKVKVDISRRACKKYGACYNEYVLFPDRSMAVVIGVGPDIKGHNQLWLIFLNDSGKASYLPDWKDVSFITEQEIKILR